MQRVLQSYNVTIPLYYYYTSIDYQAINVIVNFLIVLTSMDPDPTIRHTFWTVVVGNYLNWLATCSVNQAMVQRCLAMPNLKKSNV